MQFVIFDCLGGKLGKSADIWHLFTAESVEEAKKIAARWLTGDGLPVSGPDDRTFSLFQLTEVEGFRPTPRELWDAHLLREVLISASKKTGGDE